jgi:prepilin-type N-terminal cleavage/methylation domain-containing protein
MVLSKAIRRRAGFTLIELLVVIGIIAILATLVLTGAFRAAGGQDKANTSNTISKLASLLDQQIKAVTDQANNSQVAQVYNQLAGNDTRRGRAIWVKLNLRKDFPQSFAELADQTGYPPAPPIFKDAKAVGNTGNTNLESAALLYLTLNNARRGTAIDLDVAVGSTAIKSVPIGTGGTQFKVFVDAWGTPIAFRRVPDNSLQGELDDVKYTGSINATNRKSRDASDREGLLLSNFPPVNTTLTVASLRDYLGHQVGNSNANHNFQPYIVSAGEDQQFGTDDDIYSFRLRETGRRGD